MKKHTLAFLLALVLALGLCATAAGAEPSLSGTLGDAGQLSWQLENGSLSVQADQPWTGQVIAACYQSGRFSQVKVLTPDRPTAQVGDRVGLVKLFWLGEDTLVPQCEALRTVVAPDRTFVDGIHAWYNLVNKSSVYYVADAFAPTYICSLNGVDTETDWLQHPTALANAAARRGAVTQVFVNEQRQIYRVNCYDYTVTKLTGSPATRSVEGALQVQLPGVTDGWVDAELATGYEDLAAGDVVLYYTTPLSDGVHYTLEKPSGKLTGAVSISWSTGDLTISGTNGARYPATGLTVEGCAIPISTDAFAQWLKHGSFNVTYDFYLDASGAICWIDQLEDTQHQPCLPLAANMEDGSLRVLVRMGARTDVFTVTRLDGKAIGDGPDCISPADALAQLEADCEKAFYTYSHQADDGLYHLVRAGKDAPVDTGFTWGESYVIPKGSAIQPDADFTFGAIPCLADERTVFWVAVGAAGDKTFLSYRGFQQLPFAQAKGCVITRPDGVADCVYLDVPYFVIEPPDGCILVTDNCLVIDPKLWAEDVYQVNIMDTDGTSMSMRVSSEIADGIKEDRMEPDRFADNVYVGKLFRVTAMDQNGTVWGLEPVETYEVQALGDGSITTATGSWRYCPETHFIYADFFRELSPSELLRLSGHGSFNPNNFRAEDVGPGQLYSSVRAAVLPAADDETLAQYVYVIRECN